MLIVKPYVYAILLAALFMTYPQNTAAEERDVFKSSEFLTWEKQTREFYVRTSIGVAIAIADQNDKTHAKCISDWFENNEAGVYKQISSAMKRFPGYHPRGVILAVAEKQCGKFEY